jgi:hypothetical protein
MQALMRRAINAVMTLATLSEDSVVEATAAPTDLAALVRALRSDELLEDLSRAEPLAPHSSAESMHGADSSRNTAGP